MALFIQESEVEQLVTMADAITVVEDAFRQLGEGRAVNTPRTRIKLAGEMLHVLSAALPSSDALGLKTYTAFRTGVRFLVVLYSATTGELQALIQARYLGNLRTGAVTPVALKHMARSDASRAAIFGTGTIARATVEGLVAVREFQQIKAFGRDRDRLVGFCAEMSERTGVAIVPASDPADAVRHADVVVTATTSKDPVFDGKLLEDGATVVAVESNLLQKREIDNTVVRRAGRVVVDSIEQCQLEAGDLFVPIDAGYLHWNQVYELSDVLLGRVPGRADAREINLFKSVGLGVQDVALAALVYDRASRAGLGMEIAL